MSAKLTSQRRISPHEGQEGGSIGSASAAASFGWRNGSASPGEGVDSCRQRSQIGNPGFNICASQPPVPQVPFPKIPIATLRRHFGESLQTVCRYAAPRNITILLEPLNLYEALPGVLTSVYDAIGLIDELGVDNLGVQPDVFHMNISESSMTSALRAAGKRIRVFHMNAELVDLNDGSPLHVTNTYEITSVVVGKPDDSAFAIPTDYVERSPSEMLGEYSRRYPNPPISSYIWEAQPELDAAYLAQQE